MLYPGLKSSTKRTNIHPSLGLKVQMHLKLLVRVFGVVFYLQNPIFPSVAIKIDCDQHHHHHLEPGSRYSGGCLVVYVRQSHRHGNAYSSIRFRIIYKMAALLHVLCDTRGHHHLPLFLQRYLFPFYTSWPAGQQTPHIFSLFFLLLTTANIAHTVYATFYPMETAAVTC